MNRVFFIDRDLGRRILPTALEAAGLTVERHDDHFRPDTPDRTWLRIVAAQGWVIVSGDQKILRRPLELAAVRESRACVLVLVGNYAPAIELATNFINTLPKIDKLLAELEPPAIVKVIDPAHGSWFLKASPAGSGRKCSAAAMLPAHSTPNVTSGS